MNGESCDLETRQVTFQVRAYLFSGIVPVIPRVQVCKKPAAYRVLWTVGGR